MQFEVGDIEYWNTNVLCVTTTMCAITGLPPDQIATLLSKKAAARGAQYPAAPSTAFNLGDMMMVIQDLGGEYEKIENNSFIPYENRPTISDYLRGKKNNALKLIFCENHAANETHIFPLKGTYLVDTYTSGKRATADPEEVPDDYNNFRVKYVFVLK